MDARKRSNKEKEKKEKTLKIYGVLRTVRNSPCLTRNRRPIPLQSSRKLENVLFTGTAERAACIIHRSAAPHVALRSRNQLRSRILKSEERREKEKGKGCQVIMPYVCMYKYISHMSLCHRIPDNEPYPQLALEYRREYSVISARCWERWLLSGAPFPSLSGMTRMGFSMRGFSVDSGVVRRLAPSDPMISFTSSLPNRTESLLLSYRALLLPLECCPALSCSPIFSSLGISRQYYS